VKEGNLGRKVPGEKPTKLRLTWRPFRLVSSFGVSDFCCGCHKGSTKAEEIMRNYKDTINKHDNMGMLKWVPLDCTASHLCTKHTQLIQWKKTSLKACLTRLQMSGNVLWIKVKMMMSWGKVANVFVHQASQSVKHTTPFLGEHECRGQVVKSVEHTIPC
jgi:hypothetical protein